MAKSRLVCNLGTDDLFTLPESEEIWRKKCKADVGILENGRCVTAYVCENMGDTRKKVILKGSKRVDLVEREGT